MIAMFFFLYVGVEIGFSGWITTYAEGIGLPGANAPTWLNTVFWVSFTLGRLLAVVLAKHVRTGLMLAASCVLTVGLLAVMAVGDGSPAVVWLTTPLIGIAVAPQFATMIAYAEERIVLSGRATSWFVERVGHRWPGAAVPHRPAARRVQRLDADHRRRRRSGCHRVAAGGAANPTWQRRGRRALRRRRGRRRSHR